MRIERVELRHVEMPLVNYLRPVLAGRKFATNYCGIFGEGLSGYGKYR